MADPPLRRTLSLPLLIFYGLGTILGAGIYALVGKVGGEAGTAAPLAFLVAAGLAGLTGLSYAELSARYPRSGGEAVYVREAFRIEALSFAVGLLVTLSATVSAATLANAFSGYLGELTDLPRWVGTATITVLMGGLAAWGIRQSAWTATVMTVIELAGLLLIIWVGRDSLATLPQRSAELWPADAAAWGGVLTGAFLAFYAFIGVEDMVNVAEEVKNPQRSLPVAIAVALAAATVLYCVVALTAVLSLPPAELAGSDAPLALLYERATGGSPVIITVIGLVAVTNGILIQIIMASRILYGFGSTKRLPAFLGRVHRHTHTPLAATGLVTCLVLALALGLPLERLAEITSFFILLVFLLVNLACVRVHLRDPKPRGVRTFPTVFPLLGAAAIAAVVIFKAASFAAGV